MIKTVMIDRLEYKVVLKGETKFAYYYPVDEWLASTMPVWEIEQAIKDAENPKPVVKKTEAKPVVKPAAKKPVVKKKAVKKSKDDDVIEVLSKGPQTMRNINKATGHGATAINAVFARLGDRISSKQVARVNAWSAQNKVTVWELVA